jgi:hypothetical protein
MQYSACKLVNSLITQILNLEKPSKFSEVAVKIYLREKILFSDIKKKVGKRQSKTVKTITGHSKSTVLLKLEK